MRIKRIYQLLKKFENKTYLFFIQRHQPIYHIIQNVNSLRFCLVCFQWVSKEYSRYLGMLPAFAKLVLVVKEAEFFNYIVHDKIGINLGFVSHMLLICLAKLTDLIDVKSLVRVNFQHTNNQTSKFLTVSLRWWWKVSF